MVHGTCFRRTGNRRARGPPPPDRNVIRPDPGDGCKRAEAWHERRRNQAYREAEGRRTDPSVPEKPVSGLWKRVSAKLGDRWSQERISGRFRPDNGIRSSGQNAGKTRRPPERKPVGNQGPYRSISPFVPEQRRFSHEERKRHVMRISPPDHDWSFTRSPIHLREKTAKFHLLP